MAFSNQLDPTFPPVIQVPPYRIWKGWCIGDSLEYINANNLNFDTRIETVSSLVLSVSSYAVGLSARNAPTLNLNFNSNTNILSGEVPNNSIGTIKLGGDILQSGKALLTAASLSALSDVTITNLSANQTLTWSGSTWVNTAQTGGGGSVTDGDKGDISVLGGTWTIDPGVVNTTKLADGAVTPAKLSTGGPAWTVTGTLTASTLGVNTALPNEKLTVLGNISATGIISVSGGNSNQWNLASIVATTYQTASSSFATNTAVNTLTGLLTPLTTTNTLTGLLTLTTVTRTLTGLLTPLTTTNTLTGLLTPLTTFQTATANNIIQNGNSFGQALTIGTNDNNHLSLETAGTTRLTILSTGLVTFVGNISSNNTTTSFNQGSATGTNSFAVNSGNAYGQDGFAEGLLTIASGQASHAEGAFTRASGLGSHAEGLSSIASGNYSHAEGVSAIATGQVSHAEGNRTTASGQASHAEGNFTTASGGVSHAEGQSSEAKGIISHSAGFRATAAQDFTYAWSDGNLGTLTTNVSTTRTGQYMVSASGGVFIPGEIYAGRYTNSQVNILVSTSFGASADSFYLVNTFNGIVSATLPSTPLTGDSIKFSDPFSTWNTNLFVVNRNGNNIERLAENLFCDVAGSQFTLTFVGSSVGWKVY